MMPHGTVHGTKSSKLPHGRNFSFLTCVRALAGAAGACARAAGSALRAGRRVRAGQGVGARLGRLAEGPRQAPAG